MHRVQFAGLRSPRMGHPCEGMEEEAMDACHGLPTLRRGQLNEPVSSARDFHELRLDPCLHEPSMHGTSVFKK